MRTPLPIALAAAGLATLVAAGAPIASGVEDVVVIAVIDAGFDPYHLDWSADQLPQHLDEDPDNDVPLDQPPDRWLIGFPDPAGLAGYHRLTTTQPIDEFDSRAGLDREDADEWSNVETSTVDAQHYYWLPGTKIIGMLAFGDDDVHDGGTTHGSGTSSVAAGNLYGSCPECLVVLIDHGGEKDTGEDAINWAMDQPWIDIITNSYGFSAVSRDRIYSGSDTGRQRAASERGQTIAFSAGNGQANAFLVPNSTLYSSQEGPDWMLTVGAVSPEGASYTGHGKPADIASVGTDYPSSYCTGEVQCEGRFGGTSNATPVIAGMYARALYEARLALAGPSRIQQDGVIATGAAVTCGLARVDCELGDGELTAVELRRRLFGGAVHTSNGYDLGAMGVGTAETPPLGAEHEFLSEGHGTYFARMHDDEQWLEELDRIVGPMLGTRDVLARPGGEAEWFIVDSWCRQQLWGEWALGDFVRGTTVLPPADPAWPIRSALADNCFPLPGQ